MNFTCPVCETTFELAKSTKTGSRVTCPNCFAQMAVFKHDNKFVLGCAFCKEQVFDPENCERCERRREQKKIIEEGVL